MLSYFFFGPYGLQTDGNCATAITSHDPNQEKSKLKICGKCGKGCASRLTDVNYGLICMDCFNAKYTEYHPPDKAKEQSLP